MRKGPKLNLRHNRLNWDKKYQWICRENRQVTKYLGFRVGSED